MDRSTIIDAWHSAMRMWLSRGPMKDLGTESLTDTAIDNFITGEFDFLTQVWSMLIDLLKQDCDIPQFRVTANLARLRERRATSLIRPQVRSLINHILTGDDHGQAYQSLLALYSTLGTASLPVSTPTKTQLAERVPTTPGTTIIKEVQKHWQTELVGKNEQNLLERLASYEKEFAKGKHYSKTLLFMQGSGAGKSRLADEVGKRRLMVTYVVRDLPGGFPPRDHEMLEFLLSKPGDDDEKEMSPGRPVGTAYNDLEERTQNIWSHALIVAVLQATFEKYDKHLDTMTTELSVSTSQTSFLERIALLFHKRMAPSGGIRSYQRINFCNEVVQRATEIRAACIDEKDFRSCFRDTSASKIRKALSLNECKAMKELHAAVDKLESTLSLIRPQGYQGPLFTIVFDEISSLLKDDKPTYIALNRVISCISSNHNFWYLLLSTETRIGDLLPPDHGSGERSGPSQPSYRGVSSEDNERLQRFPPFSEFVTDITDLKNDYEYEPQKESMKHFESLKHMAAFGRPLWLAYDNPLDVAQRKIVGGKDNGFDARNTDHVFALLSMRLYLDLNVANPKSLPLAQNAVNLYMRVLEWLDPPSGTLSTTTPNEPILALAATKTLLEAWNWYTTIDTFTKELLDKYFIDKGSKGELYARLILSLAHDSAWSSSLAESTFPNKGFTFSVRELLHHLYEDSYHAELESIDESIMDAKVNFLSFSGTSEKLPGDRRSLQFLYYLLLRRCSALQLAPLQASFDLLIPFYMGSSDEPIDLKKTGAILIQVKNRVSASNDGTIINDSFLRSEPRVVVGRRSSKRVKSNSGASQRSTSTVTSRPKYLFLLFDFGVGSTSITVSQKKETVWSIHSCGNNEQTFGCLKKMQVKKAGKRFFQSEIAPPFENDIGFSHFKDQVHNALHVDKNPIAE